MLKKINKLNTLNLQLTFVYSMLLIFMMVGIIVAVTILFTDYFVNQKIEVVQSSMESISDSVENRIDDIRKVAQIVRQQNDIADSVKHGILSDKEIESLNRIYAYGLRSLMIITPDRQIINPTFIEDDYSQMLSYTGYDRFYAMNREELFSSSHSYPFYNEMNLPHYMTRISYFFKLRESPSMKPYGTIAITIEKDNLFQDKTSFIHSQLDCFYVIDGNGQVVYSDSGYDVTEPNLSHSIAISTANYSSNIDRTKEYTYFHQNVPSYPDWHLVGVLSNQAINESASALIRFVLIFGIAGILVVIVLSFLLSNRITNPIKQIACSMRIFEEGTIPDKLHVSGRTNEIVTLEHGFNNMIDSIEANIKTICCEQQEKRLAEIAALRYQLQSLQQQINPHFLYNTLNVINYLAKERKTEEITAFLQDLTRLLRATLSNTNEEITLMEEISFLKSYSHIMQYRYKGMYELVIDSDDDSRRCILPKLLLQPIVENALIHGILPSGQKSVITVQARCASGQLIVSITDEGVGIAEDKLTSLLDNKKGFTSIGLKNINDRLILCYGKDSGLTVESKQGVGTTVRFTIPAKMED